MNWSLSIFIGLFAAVAGCFGAGFVADLCVGWYRISSFEGASGYFVVFMALVGFVIGLIIGIVCSRIVARWPPLTFFKGLGLAVGSTAGLVVVIGAICRLAADLPPQINGHDLELAIEVRGPEGFVVPEATDGSSPVAEVIVFKSRPQPTGELRLKEATQVDGRWIVTATVPLDTSSSKKFLRVYFNKDYNELFPLPLRPHPNEQDLQWSRWFEAGWPVDKPKPAPEANFMMRYRVELAVPPPPGDG